MKYKTAELTGALLDAAVARAEGATPAVGLRTPFPHLRFPDGICICVSDYKPSSDWRRGGPIIEREKISVYEQNDGWVAGYGIKAEEGECYSTLTGGGPASIEFDGATGYGDTPLLAAMRAYVTSKLGKEVEL